MEYYVGGTKLIKRVVYNKTNCVAVDVFFLFGSQHCLCNYFHFSFVGTLFLKGKTKVMKRLCCLLFVFQARVDSAPKASGTAAFNIYWSVGSLFICPLHKLICSHLYVQAKWIRWSSVFSQSWDTVCLQEHQGAIQSCLSAETTFFLQFRHSMSASTAKIPTVTQQPM